MSIQPPEMREYTDADHASSREPASDDPGRIQLLFGKAENRLDVGRQIGGSDGEAQ